MHKKEIYLAKAKEAQEKAQKAIREEDQRAWFSIAEGYLALARESESHRLL